MLASSSAGQSHQRTASSRVTDLGVEALPDDPRGRSPDDRVRRDVPADHGARRDDRTVPDRHPGEDDCLAGDPHVAADRDRAVVHVVLGDVVAREDRGHRDPLRAVVPGGEELDPGRDGGVGAEAQAVRRLAEAGRCSPRALK